jgi:RNA ligase
MEYPKIETLFNRDKKTFKVIPTEFRNPVYGSINPWHWTEKIDGMNMRIQYKPLMAQDDSDVDITMSYAGKTDNAQIPGDLFKHVQGLVTAQQMRDVFQKSDVILYGEGYGAGIQKGGGGYSSTKKFILFDVLVENKWWLDHDNVVDVANKLNIQTVPSIGIMTIEEAMRLVRRGFPSFIGDRTKDAEGLVGRPLSGLFDKRGHRVIVKLKTKDFEGKQ